MMMMMMMGYEDGVFPEDPHPPEDGRWPWPGTADEAPPRVDDAGHWAHAPGPPPPSDGMSVFGYDRTARHEFHRRLWAAAFSAYLTRDWSVRMSCESAQRAADAAVLAYGPPP